MSEPLIDYIVRAFAKYLDCDPELAQELYFKHKVSLSLDNERKASVNRELSALQTASNNLDRAVKALDGISSYDDHPNEL
jgi:hypothetical protein